MDEGQNGEIVYSLSSHNPPRIRDLFNIDSRTGRIEVTGEVDYEEEQHASDLRAGLKTWDRTPCQRTAKFWSNSST